MTEHGGRDEKKNPRCIRENHWEGIIDKVEKAMVMSLANRILEQAAIREEKIEEDRRRGKLVELRRFSSRKKHVNPPSREAS